MQTKRLGILLLILFSAVTAFAILDVATAEFSLPHDPSVLSGTLRNGLKYYIRQNANPADKVELRLIVNVGSIVEDDDQLGLAHFTEHMLFNGTRSFPKGEMLDFLNSVGMGYMNGLNGMTSFDFTVYMFSLPTADRAVLDRGFLLLSEMAHAANFDPVELEKERGVIIEEWRMGQNSDSRIREQTNGVIFEGSRYANRNPIGTYEVLSTFDLDTILRFYRDWYRPDLQTVVVVGDMDPNDALEYITRHFAPIPPAEDPRPREIYTVPSHSEARSVIATDHELSRSTMNVLWKHEGQTMQSMGDFQRKLIRDLFYEMTNNRLMEQALVDEPPFSFAYAYEYPMSQAINLIYLTALIGENQAESSLAALLTEVERIRQHGFGAAELDRAKMNIMREYQNSLLEENNRESSRITWEFFSPATRGDALMSPEQSFALASMMLPEIGLEETNTLIHRLIGTQNRVFSLQALAKPGTVYPDAETLLAIADQVADIELEPWDDSSSDEPLLTEIPEPGSIVSTLTYPRSGIKRWTLSNGINLYLKQTDFKADEILITASARGGYSTLDPEDLSAAKFLSTYIMESGVGEHDLVSLGKMLPGKLIEISPSLGLYSDGFSGSSSPADLEFFMQLLYQYAHAPRWDAGSLSSSISRSMPMYVNRSLDPETAFFDTLFVVARTMPDYTSSLNARDLQAVSLEALQRVHNERFKDFSDFNFYIVGNYNEAEMMQLAKTYLANLPVSAGKRQLRDVGIRPVSGKQEIIIEKGGADKSYVALINSGTTTTNADEAVYRDAMMMVLNEKLRENIREERSGVYFVQAMLSPQRYPYPYYNIYTVMSCSADRVSELSEAIIATMDSIRTGQFADKYIETAKVTMQQNHQQRMRQNRYWLSNMTSSHTVGRPIDRFLDNPERYSKINRENIVSAAQHYLNTDDSLIKLIMNPERN